jgi:hypothetical protein
MRTSILDRKRKEIPYQSQPEDGYVPAKHFAWDVDRLKMMCNIDRSRIMGTRFHYRTDWSEVTCQRCLKIRDSLERLLLNDPTMWTYEITFKNADNDSPYFMIVAAIDRVHAQSIFTQRVRYKTDVFLSARPVNIFTHLKQERAPKQPELPIPVALEVVPEIVSEIVPDVQDITASGIVDLGNLLIELGGTLAGLEEISKRLDCFGYKAAVQFSIIYKGV